ncbi:MAG: TetR/AcrR family transcriptional regulator [Proteobacteria bacterium]|nr:MAG: TetR/AcrR family transcriptional regulator [Pseudomonadota bacterium]
MAAAKRDTRSELLSTGMELIWCHNYGSVSVDEICKKAGAQKGSFYHFFPSKADLAIAALENTWTQMQPELDHIFSPQLPGLRRLQNYADYTLKQQEQERERLGFVVGCPFTTIGSEQSAEKDGISKKAWEILVRFQKYFYQAIRDACEEGCIKVGDPQLKASQIIHHYLGALACARLSGDLAPMRDLYSVWMGILR